MRSLFKNPFARFFAVALLLYIGWYFVYELYLHPMGFLDVMVINNSIFFTEHLLQLLGYDVFTQEMDAIRTIGIDGTHGLWIGDPCNGLTLFALFSGFIIAFPGPWKHKLWFIPAGIILIHFMNIIRITALSLIVKHAPEALEFNHTYTFTFLVYGFIFILWVTWVNKFSGFKKKMKEYEER